MNLTFRDFLPDNGLIAETILLATTPEIIWPVLTAIGAGQRFVALAASMGAGSFSGSLAVGRNSYRRVPHIA